MNHKPLSQQLIEPLDKKKISEDIHRRNDTINHPDLTDIVEYYTLQL